MGSFDFVAAGALLLAFASPFLLMAGLFMMLSAIMPERAEAVKQGFPRVILGVVLMSVASVVVTAAAGLKTLFPTAMQPLFDILAPLLAPSLFLMSFYYIVSVIEPSWGAKADKYLANTLFGIVFLSLITTLVTNLGAFL